MANEIQRRHLHTWRNPATGLLETIDIETGDIVMRQLTEKGPLVESHDSSAYIFNPTLADLICNDVANGMDLHDACKLDGRPAIEIVRNWKRRVPDFAEKLKEATKERGEYYRNLAVSQADVYPESKLDLETNKFKADTYWKAASFDNPEQYGNRTKIEASGVGMIVLDTGINRSEPINIGGSHGEDREDKRGDIKELDEPGDGSAGGPQGS